MARNTMQRDRAEVWRSFMVNRFYLEGAYRNGTTVEPGAVASYARAASALLAFGITPEAMRLQPVTVSEEVNH